MQHRAGRSYSRNQSSHPSKVDAGIVASPEEIRKDAVVGWFDSSVENSAVFLIPH